MAKNPAPQAAAEPEATQAPPPPSPPISFAEPAAQLADGAVVSDEKPAGFQDPVVSPQELAALHAEANRENQKRNFVQQVLAARTQPPEPVYDAPVAPRIIEQTNAELEAGRALVAKNEQLQAARRPPQAEPEGSKPVFRPADYVPDQKKGQGNTQARTL